MGRSRVIYRVQLCLETFRSGLACGRPGRRLFVARIMSGRAGGLARQRGTSGARPTPHPLHPLPLSAPPLIPHPTPTPPPSQVSLGVAIATDAGFGTQILRAPSEQLGGGMAEAETETEEWTKTRGCRKILQTLEGAIEQFKFHSR